MTLKFKSDSKRFEIELGGDFIAFDDNGTKEALYRSLQRFRGSEVVFVADDLKKWDSSLVVILFEVARLAERNKLKVSWASLPENLSELVHLALEVDRKPEQKKNIHIAV